MMQGGTELGALGLSRLYTLHVAVLPLLLGAMLWARSALLRKHGWSDERAAVAPWRDHLQRGVVVGALVVVALFAATRGDRTARRSRRPPIRWATTRRGPSGT